MSGTTIGEVNINLRMSLAQFKKDVQDGTDAAGSATKKLAEDTKGNMSEARGSLMLLGEEIGVHIPRHLQNFISQLPGVSTALTAAFNSVAILALLEVITKIIEKVKEFSEATDKAAAEQKKFNEAMDEYVHPSDQAAQAIEKIGEQLNKQVSGMAAQSTISKTVAEGFASIGQTVREHLPALQDFIEMFAKGDPKLKDFATSMQFFTERVKEMEKLDGPKAALAEVTAELKALSESAEHARPDVANAITALEAMQAALGKQVDDNFNKSVEDAAKAAKEAIDAEWESYQRMLKIAEQSHVDTIDTLPGVHTVKDMQMTGVYTDQAPNAGAQGQQKPTDLGAGIETNPEYVGANPELVKIQNDQKAAMQDAIKIYDQTRTAAQKYADQVAILNELLKQGKIDQDTYDRAMKQAAETQNSTSKDMQKLGADIGKTIEQATLFGRNWTDAFKSVAIQVAELILKMTLLKSLTSTAQGGGGFFTSLLGGLVGGLPGRASGGPVDAGHAYMVGESGPEFFLPHSAGTIIPHDAVKSAGGTVHNEFHMHVNGVTDFDGFKQSSSQIAADMLHMMATASRRNS